MASRRSNDRNGLWREARKMRGVNNCLPELVDNVSGEKEIAGLFGNKFKDIFNSVNYDHDELDKIKEELSESIINKNSTDELIQDKMNYELSEHDIKLAMKSLASGKSDGNIGIFSDHIIRGSDLLHKYILLLYNAMLNHGYTPELMCMGTIIPLVKNKRQCTNNSDNFRGICLQSSLCKLLDIIILHKETSKLQTSENQFGFKPKMSTEVAAAIVKDTIDYYKSKGGMVYCMSLDASKAFDRVDFCKLFRLLIERNVDPIIVRLLINMYTNQKNRVKYNQSYSDVFNISNGVKQGGVLSPTLFCIYMDNLLKNLGESGFGCKMGDAYVGCICYADDILLLSGSLFGLKKLINICEDYAKEHKIRFNGNKSKLIIFNQGNNDLFLDVFVCGDIVERVSELKYLGLIFSCGSGDSFQSAVSKDFICKFNIFMSDFNKVNSKLKNYLFNTYCCSFYGSNMCKFQNLDLIDIQWKKAIRRIWKLPYRARSKLLPHISNSLPPSICFIKHFIKFYLKNIQSSNSVVKNVFQASLSNDTRIGNNIRYILYKYNLTVDYLKHENTDFNTLWNVILSKWKMSCDDNFKRIGEHILELVSRRDSLEPWILSKGEIQKVINLISTQDPYAIEF